MPQIENRQTRLALKAGIDVKSPSRLVLRGQGKSKKVLEDTVNIGNTTPTPKSLRSFPTKVPTASPKRTRPSILPKHQSASLTSPKGKKVIETKENVVSTDDLETRIRYALAASARRRADSMKSVQGDPSIVSYGEASRPGSVKSVKWDPAIISLSESPRARNAATEDVVLESPQTSPKSMSENSFQEGDIDELFDALVLWKKRDPCKVRKILEELKYGNSDDSVTSTLAPVKTTVSISSTTTKKLNPSALPFADITNRSSKTLHNYPKQHNASQLHIPKKRHSQSLTSLQTNMQSPIWINTSSKISPQIQPFQLLPQCLSLPILQPLPFNPYMFVPPLVPVIPQEPLLPSEDEHGRVAHAIDRSWAEAILVKFVLKYPLTGKLKAKSPTSPEGRYAAEIQQRLEYLLLQEKEKKALEQLSVNNVFAR